MDLQTDAPTPEERRAERLRHWMELLSAVLMAAATIATAWSAYQSSLWNGQYSRHKSQSTTAIIRAGELSNLALQRTSIDVSLFMQWVLAVNNGDSRMADFLFVRFPEPLRTAASAWRATSPLTNSKAPPSPFDMPEYLVRERRDSDRWEEVATTESVAGERAYAISSRYLMFTIVFASVLCFAGIGGKFRWQVIDLAVLVLGVLTLVVGVVIMLTAPRV